MHQLLPCLLCPLDSRHSYRDVDSLYEVTNDLKYPPLDPPCVFKRFSKRPPTPSSSLLPRMPIRSARTNAYLFKLGVVSSPFSSVPFSKRLGQHLVHVCTPAQCPVRGIVWGTGSLHLSCGALVSVCAFGYHWRPFLRQGKMVFNPIIWFNVCLPFFEIRLPSLIGCRTDLFPKLATSWRLCPRNSFSCVHVHVSMFSMFFIRMLFLVVSFALGPFLFLRLVIECLT